jgi:parvulin-like peptidyl-prolyl isomerase
MKHIRSIITLGCLAAMAATSGAQGFRSGSGITDIMRAGPRLGPSAPRAVAPPAAAPVQRAAEYIVALVNSEPITNTEVQTRVTRLVKENAEAARYPRDELTRLVLDRLILERAQLQLAKESGIKVDEVAIDQAEQTVARQNEISLVELRRRVAAEGIAAQDFRNDLRDQLLLTRLRDREVESKVKISDTEADEYLRDQRNTVVKDTALLNLNLAQVLVALPETATDAQVATAQKKAQGLADRARAGEDFAKLVRENSDSPDRANGGAIGRCSSMPCNRWRSTASPARFAPAPASMCSRSWPRPRSARPMRPSPRPRCATSCCSTTPSAPRHRRWHSWRNSSAACRPARPTSPVLRATTRRTGAPRKAATSAGRARASSCPSSRKPWTGSRRARSATPWCRVSACT